MPYVWHVGEFFEITYFSRTVRVIYCKASGFVISVNPLFLIITQVSHEKAALGLDNLVGDRYSPVRKRHLKLSKFFYQGVMS